MIRGEKRGRKVTSREENRISPRWDLSSGARFSRFLARFRSAASDHRKTDVAVAKTGRVLPQRSRRSRVRPPRRSNCHEPPSSCARAQATTAMRRDASHPPLRSQRSRGEIILAEYLPFSFYPSIFSSASALLSRCFICLSWFFEKHDSQNICI